MDLLKEVKKELESQGTDFQSDWWTDDMHAFLEDIVESAEKVFKNRASLHPVSRRMNMNNRKNEIINALFVVARLFLTIIIAMPCYLLVIPFWLLGVEDPWDKMSRLFDELTFNN